MLNKTTAQSHRSYGKNKSFPKFFWYEKFLCVIKYRKKKFYVLEYKENRSDPLIQKFESKNFHAA